MKTIEVAAAVIFGEGRVFATQRGYGEYKDGWEFPGGKLKPGETPEEALAREIREELDTEIDVGPLIGTVACDYPGFRLRMHCYRCRVVSGRLELREHEAARWLGREELDSVGWLPADRMILPAVLESWPQEKQKGHPEKEEKTMSSLYHRISVRKYQNRPVEREKIEAMLRAAMQAPSAANQQPWEFFVVTDRKKLEALAGVSPYAGMTKDAPAAIVSAYRAACALPEYAQIDLSIAMENLWLETDAQGLGGVWLGIAPVEARMRAVEAVVGMPESLRAFAVFPFGYPAEERRQQDRFDPARIHWVE